VIDPNFLDTERDWTDVRNAFRLGVEIMECFPNDYKGEAYNFDPRWAEPGAEAQLDAFIRSETHSAYHLSCSCAMGKVVEPTTGKVFGTSNLRVVDASIFPSMTSGNLNAPTIMLAEKLSDSILGKAPLPSDEGISWWKPPQGMQRSIE